MKKEIKHHEVIVKYWNLGSTPPLWTDIGRAGPCNPNQNGWEHWTVIEHMRLLNSDYRPKMEISNLCERVVIVYTTKEDEER